MAKYFVLVNDKYMTSVESTSNAGAEHALLDNVPGIHSALAFDDATLQGDYFRACLLRSELIDTCHLCELFAAQADRRTRLERIVAALAEADAEYTKAADALTLAQIKRDGIAADLADMRAEIARHALELNIKQD